MNTKNLKAYAPKARSQFIEAIKKRAAQFGIYEGENGETRIVEVQIEGSVTIIEGRAFTRQEGEQRKRLDKKVAERGYDMFIREMAYTWFNRLAAIRYMELHGYFDHGFRVLSHPSSVDSLPEILSHASDVADGLKLDKSHIIELQLAGDKEEQLYRELLLGQCHQLANIMPFVFKGLTADSIDDAAELLLPDNLTKTDSILKGLITDIPEEDWNDIEVIGWLYQFYISEHKDAVIGKVVKSEDIPAATQLFTPNWIVKYLVQNSVGRQWLATYPDSELKGKMEYYIEPAEQSDEVIQQLKDITPTSIDPEEIKVLDPAAGSGHILVEVYEVLREIYLERGYRLREIPELILTKNIYGLDIDDRAAQLAGFALMMKAREDDRRIFQRVEEGEVSLNVYSLQSTEGLDITKLWRALNIDNAVTSAPINDLFSGETEFDPVGKGKIGDYFVLLNALIGVFRQAKTLGSLIDFERFMQDEFVKKQDAVTRLEIQRTKLNKERKKLVDDKKSATELEKQIAELDFEISYQIQANNQFRGVIGNLAQSLQELLKMITELTLSSDPSAKAAAIELHPILEQAVVLVQNYDAIIANPPYMGGKGMNGDLKNFAKLNFPNSKSDLYSMMFERSFAMLKKYGFHSMIVMEGWMFLSSYEKFRSKLLKNHTVLDLIHMPYNGRGRTSLGINFGTTASVMRNNIITDFNAHFSNIRYNEIDTSGVPLTFPTVNEKTSFVNVNNFLKLPGNTLAYWADSSLIELFANKKIEFESGGRCKTTNDEVYLRKWWEVSKLDVGTESKWTLLSKGGEARKYYGNVDTVIRWDQNAKVFYKSVGGLTREEFWGMDGITWTIVSSKESFSFRYKPTGVQYNSVSPTIFGANIFAALGVLNSSTYSELLKTIAPTLAVNVGEVLQLPLDITERTLAKISTFSEKLVSLSKSDWDKQEVSVDFSSLEFLANCKFLRVYFDNVREQSLKTVCEYIYSREEIDKLVSSDLNVALPSLKPDVDLICDRNYDDEDEYNKFRSTKSTELISFIVGCSMGRYSLDREGLIYAYSGNKGFKELIEDGAYHSFPADDDGIVPLASDDWLFDDDATTRFKEFVKTVWGGDNLSENLEYVAESLCLHALKPVKGENANDTVRRYFSKQFYKDHCKTYKKRPIYWLFSSGKEKAFECLVYLHRYNEGTLSRMRTEYVTPLMGKFDAQHTLLSEQQIQATGTEARRIEKELITLDKKQAELRTFDEQLKHYAEKRITLDLDDGVKANYGKFGNLLADVKAIHGKAVK